MENKRPRPVTRVHCSRSVWNYGTGKAFNPDRFHISPPTPPGFETRGKQTTWLHQRRGADVKSTEEKPRRDCCSSCCFHYVRVSLAGLPGYRLTLGKIKNRMYMLEERLKRAVCVQPVRLHNKGLQTRSSSTDMWNSAPQLHLWFWK